MILRKILCRSESLSVELSCLTLSYGLEPPWSPRTPSPVASDQRVWFFLPLCPRNPWRVTKLSGALSNIPMDGWLPVQVFLLGWVCHTYTLYTSSSEDIQKLFQKNRQCLVAPEDLALIDWLSKPLWKLQTASWKNGPQSFQETKVVFLIFLPLTFNAFWGWFHTEGKAVVLLF